MELFFPTLHVSVWRDLHQRNTPVFCPIFCSLSSRGQGAHLRVTNIGPHFPNGRTSEARKMPSLFFSLSFTISPLHEVTYQCIWKKELNIPPQALHFLSRDLCSDLLSGKGKQSTLCGRSVVTELCQ